MDTKTKRWWAVCALALATGCGESAETDNAQTRYEFEEPAERATSGSYGILPLPEGTMVVLGTRIVYVANGTQAVTTIQEASRFHGSLKSDDNYVYYATQRADRARPATSNTLENPNDADGKIFRVSKRPPFKPEPLIDVNILSGDFSIDGGHLFVCESPGLNSEGRFIDMPLEDPGKTLRPMLGFNKFCNGAIASGERVYLLLDRTRATDEKKFVLGAVSRPLPGAQWNVHPAVDDLVTTDVVEKETLYFARLLSRKDELVVVNGADATVYSKAGAKTGALTAGARLGLARPFGEAMWVWSKNSNGGKEGGRICDGGRLYGGSSPAAATELTQNVCDVAEVVASDKELLFLETASILEPAGDKLTVRYRLKALPLPAL